MLEDKRREVLAKLDREFKHFPDIAGWNNVSVDLTAWDQKFSILKAKKQSLGQDVWQRASEYALRAAAVDTGAVEGLYPMNRAITYSIATFRFSSEPETQTIFEDIKPFVEGQLLGYKMAESAAMNQSTLINETWIKILHRTVTLGTETNAAVDQDKPGFTPTENQGVMELEKLAASLKSQQFNRKHPVVQAAYSLYAFLKLHPFADGRVARALASFFLIREFGIPLIVYSDQRDLYVNALRQADEGRIQILVDFIFDRCAETMELMESLVSAAMYPVPEDMVKQISEMYVGYSGLAHEELDEIGMLMINLSKNALLDEAHKSIQGPIRFEVNIGEERYSTSSIPAGYRPLVGNTAPIIYVSARTRPPAQASESLIFRVFISRKGEPEGCVLITDPSSKHLIKFDIEDIKTANKLGKSTGLFMRLHAWAMGVIGDILSNVKEQANRSFRESPYFPGE